MTFQDVGRPGAVTTCLATVSLGGTLTEKIQAASAAGFDGVELLDDDLIRSGFSASEAAARCHDAGLSIDLYQPFRRAEGVSQEEFPTVLSRFRSELDTMGALGVEAILVVSNTDEDAIGDLALSSAQLYQLADEAAQRNMQVHFEALAWGRHINTLHAAWQIVHEADHPSLFVVVDTFHALARGEFLQSNSVPTHQVETTRWSGLPHEAVGFLQLADAHTVPKNDVSNLAPAEITQWSRNHRCFPGEGAYDVAPVLNYFLSQGYQGPISLEIFNPGYRNEPPAQVARRGADALNALLENAVSCDVPEQAAS